MRQLLENQNLIIFFTVYISVYLLIHTSMALHQKEHQSYCIPNHRTDISNGSPSPIGPVVFMPQLPLVGHVVVALLLPVGQL